VIAPELAQKRLGMLTASMAAVIMGGTKTEGLAKYVRRLAGERVFGDLGEESFRSVWMARGDETENAALDWYEFEHDVSLERQAHTVHATIPFVAATPDGLLPTMYTVEGKCPLFHVWCETFDLWRGGTRGLDAVPSEYRWQCRWQPWTLGLRAGRFIAFHPVGGGQGVVIPYEITQSEIEQMTERAFLVNEMVREQEERLRSVRRAA
jgi:hypothetical protein